MNKKWIMTLIAACICVQSTGLMALNTTNTSKLEVTTEQKGTYLTQTGEIAEINKEGDTYDVLVGSPIDGIRVILPADTMIIDAQTLKFLSREDLKQGMDVTVVMDKNAPITLSLPAMYSSPNAILINSPDRNIEVAYFDETLTNEKHTLQLNIEKNTQMMNNLGERKRFAAEDIQNKDAIVFYTTSTRSIPAQTTPELVMIMETETDESVEQEYIALRPEAEAKGYKITWNAKNQLITLTKGQEKVVITLGKTDYTHNGKKISLDAASKKENGITYVPKAVLESLK